MNWTNDAANSAEDKCSDNDGSHKVSPVMFAERLASLVGKLGPKLAIWLSLADHFLAVGIEGVVDDPFR